MRGNYRPRHSSLIYNGWKTRWVARPVMNSENRYEQRERPREGYRSDVAPHIQEAQREIVREQLQRVVIAPLLLICGILLLVSAVGAAVSGSFVLAALIFNGYQRNITALWNAPPI